MMATSRSTSGIADQAGRVLSDRYRLVAPIGTGASAQVPLADDLRLGMFVIARLATRHGIAVTLRPSPYGGTTAIMLLPHDIVVQQIEEVPETFNPRFDALSRIYRYQIWNHRWPSAIWARYSWHVSFPLNIEAMNRTATLLIGEHDFSSFQGADWVEHNPQRTVLRSEVRQERDFLIYDVEGHSFLRHMVRNIVGTLVDVGRGALSIEDFAAIFAAHDRTHAGVNAPPQGLFLVFVTY